MSGLVVAAIAAGAFGASLAGGLLFDHLLSRRLARFVPCQHRFPRVDCAWCELTRWEEETWRV